MLRSKLSVIVAVTAALVSSQLAGGAELGALNKYLADDVVAVAYVDLTKVDISAAVDDFARLEVANDAELALARKQASAVQMEFEELTVPGATRVFALLRMSDLAHGGPTWIAEVKPGGDAEQVAAVLKGWFAAARQTPGPAGGPASLAPAEVVVEGDVVLGAASAVQLEIMKASREGAPREGAQAALDVLLSSDAGFIAFGDDDSRRVLREMFPQLPAPFMEIDGKLLADGVDWAAVTLKLPPDPVVGVAIEATNDDALNVMSGAADKGLAMLKAMVMAASVQGDGEAASLIPVVALLKPETKDQRISVILGDDEEELVAFRQVVAPAVRAAREAARRSQRMNNFKHIALAMLNYESAKKSYPPAASYDAAGKPLLSWRVHVLPYIEQQALYDEFHLDEPWDSEHNRKLIARMPAVYADPSEPGLAAQGRTTYQVPVGEGTVFGAREGTPIREIRDGTSNTILAVEVVADRAVPWTKPEDWEVDFDDPLRGVRRGEKDDRGGVFSAAYCDGSVRVIHSNIDSTVFKSLLTFAGEETVPGY
jgi:hypothetical protein